MSWPSKEEIVDAIDWSWYQQNNGVFIDVDEFVAQNPNVKVVMLRACWVNGTPDKSYAVYANAFRKHEDIVVIAYLWPNPLRTDMIARWTEALLTADEMPDAIMLDFELTFHETDAVLTKNAEQSFRDAELFDLPILGYTRGNWWEIHIKTTVELGRTFIVAHYPYFLINGKWQQCLTHADLHKNLPIGNSFTPYLGRLKPAQTIGWQCSEKGRLAPHAPRAMDLDTFITKMFIEWYGSDPWADEPTEPDPEPGEPAKVVITATGFGDPMPTIIYTEG